MSKISVIIPCHNSFKLMKNVICSLENQTFRDFEVIVVDDCSDDDSYEKLMNYKEKSKLEVTVLKNDKNSGPGAARNLAINYSTSEWLAFCDSDDWYEYDFLERMIESANKNNADIVMCNYNKVFNNGNKVSVDYTSVFCESSTKREIIAYSKSSLCLLLVKRYLFDDLKIPSLFNGEDIAIVPVLLSKAKKIIALTKSLYCYYIRDDSVSNRPSVRIFDNILDAYKVIQNLIPNKFSIEKEFLCIKAVLYGGTLNAFKAGNSIKQIKKEVEKFKIAYPNWIDNPYIKSLGRSKVIYLKCLWHRIYFLNLLLAKIHYYYTQR